MDGQTLVFQHLTGQDQMFSFPTDAPDPTGPQITPHCDESEGLIADAQVILVHLPTFVGADCLNLFQFVWMEEGLCGSVTVPVVLDVRLPFILIERVRSPRADVALDKGVEAVIPF